MPETLCTKTSEPHFKAGWKGVAILFRLGFEGDILNTFASKDGRILIVNMEYKNNVLSFASIYAPNSESDRVVFFDELHQLLCTHVMNLESLVIAADFNCCMNLSDRFPISIRANLISDDQTGYVKNRYIGVSARHIIDIIKYCEDFNKPFDTLDWNFLFGCLRKYNFGDNFTKGIKI